MMTATESTIRMCDDSWLTPDQIEGRIREVKSHLEAIQRLEKQLGSILMDTPESTAGSIRRRWSAM